MFAAIQRHLSLALMLTMLLVSGLSGVAEARTREPKVDPIPLAGMLLRDGNYDKAKAELDKIELDDLEDPELQKYYTFRGIIALQTEAYKEAITAFEKATSIGEPDLIIYVYLSQCHFASENWQAAIDAFHKSGEVGRGVGNAYFIVARAHTQLGQLEQAWDMLEAGVKRFPANVDFAQEQILFLFERGLFAQAIERGLKAVENPEASLDLFLTIGEAFRRRSLYEELAIFMEGTVLRYPDSEKAWLLLGHAYAKQSDFLIAGDILQRSAELNPQHAHSSADFFRRAGSIDRAIYMNSQVDNQERKLKQRLMILLDTEQFEFIAGMERRLKRNGLLDDGMIAYALAYALYQVGHFGNALDALDLITDSGVYQKALQLREAITLCVDEPTECAQ